jgi:parallel beta-helix repeat protein
MKPAAAAALAAAALAVASPASAQTVSCGQVITKSTRLQHDLSDCPRDGLVIGADNITLDLNGHTIDGDERHQSGESTEVGVRNADFEEAAHQRVVIKNGIIRGFSQGVLLFNASDTLVRALSLIDNGVGVTIDGPRAEANVVTHNSVSDNLEWGIRVEDEFADNVSAGRNRVSGNHVFRNGGQNIILSGTADGNVIEKNTIHDARSRGVGTFPRGILLSDSFGHSVIRKNLIFDNPGFGIGFIESRNTLVEKNVILRSGVDGIGLLDDEGNEVRKNFVSQSGDDGIDVQGPSTLIRNTASNNGDLGIEAVEGVIDGGGNRASGNGNPLQCVNVFCR